jgi:hypothetical protein
VRRGEVWWCLAGHGGVGHGWVRQGFLDSVMRGFRKRHLIRFGMVWQGTFRLGPVGWGLAGQGMVRQGEVRQGRVGLGMVFSINLEAL